MIFEFLISFRMDKEFYWLEYIKFLKFELEVLNAKKYFIDVYDIEPKFFNEYVPEFLKKKIEILEKIMKSKKSRISTFKTLGWFNIKEKVIIVEDLTQKMKKFLFKKKIFFQDFLQRIKKIDTDLIILNNRLKNLK